MQRFWVLSVTSESGDSYGPSLFEEKLDDSELEVFLHNQFPDEWEEDDGPGIFGSYLHIKWDLAHVYGKPSISKFITDKNGKLEVLDKSGKVVARQG